MIKGWTTATGGRAFLLADIEFDTSNGELQEQSMAPNELKLEVKRLFRARLPRVEAAPQCSALPTPPKTLPKDNTKTFYARPSLACLEGSHFPVSPLLHLLVILAVTCAVAVSRLAASNLNTHFHLQATKGDLSYSKTVNLATLSAVIEKEQIAELRLKEQNRLASDM